MDMAANNQIALEELEHGSEAAALDLLRRNVRKHPCCTTLHNLGVYYTLYGMLLRNGNVRSAGKLGLRYLRKAAEYAQDFQNMASIATAEWKCGDFDAGIPYFCKSVDARMTC